ncbi:anti-sigma factor domain-containing protein [Clostridium tagluense]|uniref:anti-sigma factor domain-containing protein n=1 Tax=Clostridium tagluense TaxID=360422 RepID=UPI001C6DEBF6|nr:anti-sigma factor domain-containing protein [Clostridium tagluense]MBW9158279.1 anti-sigma factor domain-containing protein [Clostridium tagluense]WLC66636.1 anti-sigma factor domain-containing protein [Clostridium tagluense]
MIKTGIVMCIVNKKVGIMTSSGEFVYIKISKVLPKVGEIHTGELYKKNLFHYKYAITAASLMFLLISSVAAYSYYTPVTDIVININPSISLKANRWNKIISSKGLNSDGSTILNNIVLNNKSIDSGLELLVKEAKSENFINAEYINDKKNITVDIKGNKDNSIDISNFKNIIDSNNLNIIINSSSRNNKKVDITVNNKKLDISTLNENSHKKESISKNENAKKHLQKESLADINTNKSNDKSSQIKEKVKNSDKPIKRKEDKLKEDDKSENKNSNNSSNTKENISPNKVKTNLQNKKIKSVKMYDDNNSKNNSFQMKKKDSDPKRSNSYENQQKTDNALNKFLKDFKD